MGLTQIFIIMTVVSAVLAVVFSIASASALDSVEPKSGLVSTAFAIIAAIFVAGALSGFVGSIWSLNSNTRETMNRCFESGGYVARVDETSYCLDGAPPIKWKL